MSETEVDPLTHADKYENVKTALYLTGLLPESEGDAKEVISLMLDMVALIHRNWPPPHRA